MAVFITLNFGKNTIMAVSVYIDHFKFRKIALYGISIDLIKFPKEGFPYAILNPIPAGVLENQKSHV